MSKSVTGSGAGDARSTIGKRFISIGKRISRACTRNANTVNPNTLRLRSLTLLRPKSPHPNTLYNIKNFFKVDFNVSVGSISIGAVVEAVRALQIALQLINEVCAECNV